MKDVLDLEDLLRRNPQIDRRQLEDARELLKQLRARGVQRKSYDLAPPFGGRRVTVRDQETNVIRLRSLPTTE